MKRVMGHARDQLILRIIERIESDTQVIGAPEREAVWERGWAEALAKFRANPCEESLIPAFIHNTQPVRYRNDLYIPDDNNNELMHCRRMQKLIGERLDSCNIKIEFGCGTGWNLAALASPFNPEKSYYGLDFSQSAIGLIDQINKKLFMRGLIFDMKKPCGSIPHNAGIFTFGSVEQLSQHWQPFFEYLISCKPQVVVHVEPVLELYDPRNLLDALAIRFHKKRGYAHGWLPWLQNDPRVEVLDIRRSYFGSLMHEGYSMVVWKPK